MTRTTDEKSRRKNTYRAAGSKRVGRGLSRDVVIDDVALLSLLHAMFEHNAEHRRLTRRIVTAQGRLKQLATEAAWLQYLVLEAAVNERTDLMLTHAARRVFNESRRRVHGAR